MKKQSTVLYILRLTVTLLLITGIMAALLAGVNAVTKDKIAAAKEQKTKDAIAKVLPEAKDPKELELTGDTGIVKQVFEVDGAYAIQVAPAGFGGEISLMVGIRDGKVTGISVISHAETAGLGSVAADKGAKGQAFRAQFEGKSGELAVNKDGGEIDAITSSTITSRAVVTGVNAALEYAAKLG